MHNQFYSVKAFFISLLLSIGIGITVNGQTVDMYRENWSTGGDGTVASIGNIMVYRVTTTNTTSANITSSMIYGNIPAGTSYVAGSTTVNGASVADVSGKMPFGSGGLINSPTSGAGIIAPSASVVIEYYVKVNSNGGGYSNDATLQGTTSSGTVIVKSNTVSTSITADATCTTIYQSAASTNTQGGLPTYPFKYIKSLNQTTGTGTTIYSGPPGPAGVLTNTEAIAYAPHTTRLYFVNNNAANTGGQDLCYVDIAAGTATRYTGYPLETNTASGYNINRMSFCADGYGYALTANAQDFIRFSIDPVTDLPLISRLGLLVNDVNNGSNNVLTETGGDFFGDASGKLYLIPDSRKLYMINPATLVATYLGTITVSGQSTTGVTGVAADMAGNIYIGGLYTYVYKVDLGAMSAVQLNTTTTNVFKTGDYSSCAFPILAPVINVTKTYTNTSGASSVRAGDPIEYTIEVSNTGNFASALVKLYDAIPANSYYIAGSTSMNGIAVADIGGAMPFSVAGGQYINSAGEGAGIIKSGDANKVVIKFRVTTDEYKTVCNQAVVTFPDADGNTKYVFSDDPAQSGTTDPTCLYSDKGLVSIQATKTYIDNDLTNIGVISGDPIDYVITVTNSGGVNATGVKIIDAIPTYSHYVANSTTMNGVAVADIGGVMPFAVSGGTLINSAGEPAGVVAPGDANKVVVKFRVLTDPRSYVCNQATVNYTDPYNAARNVYSDDPTQAGTQDATCFYSDGALGSRMTVNNKQSNTVQPNTVLPALTESVKVQPNPFVKDLNLQIELPAAETIQVRLIDFYGRTVYATSRNAGAGVNSLKVTVPAGLSRGVYVLEVLAGRNRLMSKKLIKR